MPDIPKKYDQRHLNQLLAYERKIWSIYNDLINEISQIAKLVPNFDPSKPFKLSQYPLAKERADQILTFFRNELRTTIISGIDAEWTLSNNKNSELTKTVYGKALDKISPDKKRLYFGSNEKALEAFKKRKVKGLSLSQRVWRYTNQFKGDIEMAIDLGLRKADSASELSRDLRSYLREPDKLYRRVRNEHGELHLSKNAKNYHPGRGVYRSSYQNARRMAATEINMAYRSADHERWQQMDFVLGQEIKLSNNHTLNGKPFRDICDHLAGKYPKDFKFIGWHPLCRCRSVSVLLSPDEFIEQLEGKDFSGKQLTKVPGQFNSYISENKDRIKRSSGKGTLPYFLKDNRDYWE